MRAYATSTRSFEHDLGRTRVRQRIRRASPELSVRVATPAHDLATSRERARRADGRGDLHGGFLEHGHWSEEGHERSRVSDSELSEVVVSATLQGPIGHPHARLALGEPEPLREC